MMDMMTTGYSKPRLDAGNKQNMKDKQGYIEDGIQILKYVVYQIPILSFLKIKMMALITKTK